MRVCATIAYDGSRFNGFQIQNSGVDTVANRLTEVLSCNGIYTKIHASGRTDTGVHATGQVIHFDIPEYWKDLDRLKNLINHNALPHVYVKHIEAVDDDFHARYSAQKRVYRYIVSTKTPSVFETPYVLFVDSFHFEKIYEAAKLFEGTHDFTMFMKQNSSVKTSVRTIYKSYCYQHQDYNIFYFEANGFLRSQIRMMVKFLLDVGDGRRTRMDLLDQLTCRKRHTTQLVAPNGLYLSRIKY